MDINSSINEKSKPTEKPSTCGCNKTGCGNNYSGRCNLGYTGLSCCRDFWTIE